ncbi:SH3 domain-containing protein [Robertkochia sediminum]|uniref:SH3 domain-containing protein n=1 Tax=Robertkochia sediminum TaxID=2785326 RepID=UPI0019313833|nr:SH3 domain-containing protein [Robertkochia sediminum]MBL7471198.1 SH3 domain-containing protein [Robertkochia sediminum]
MYYNIVLLTLSLFISNSIYSQQNSNVDTASLDALKREINVVDNQIDTLISLKKELQSKVVILEGKKEDLNVEGVKAAVSYSDPYLREEPDYNSKKLYQLKFKDTVLVLSRYEDTNWVKVSHNGVVGFLLYGSLQENPEVLAVFDHTMARKLEILTKNYGRETAQRIIRKTYWIGMTDQMARESLGHPQSVNRSKGSWGIHEQWVYRERNKTLYLYFENGRLASYQKQK